MTGLSGVSPLWMQTDALLSPWFPTGNHGLSNHFRDSMSLRDAMSK